MSSIPKKQFKLHAYNKVKSNYNSSQNKANKGQYIRIPKIWHRHSQKVIDHSSAELDV